MWHHFLSETYGTKFARGIPEGRFWLYEWKCLWKRGTWQNVASKRRQPTSHLKSSSRFFFDQPQNDTLFVSVGTNLAIQFSMLAHLLAMPRSKQETGGMMLIRHDKKYGRKIIGRLLPGRKHLDPFKKTMWLPLFFVFPPSFTKRIFFPPPQKI